MKKKILSLVLTLSMIFGILAVLAACAPADPDPNARAESFVALDINPSVELTVDDKGYVLSAYGANEDAQVLLYGEEGIVGVKLEDAVERITDLAVELGYINENNKVISASVYAESDSLKSGLEGKIEASVSRSAGKANIKLTVNSEELYSIIRELEAYKAQNPNSEKIQNLTVSKYRLALSASEGGEITLNAAIELDNEALIAKINEAHKKAEAFATKAFNKAREEASRAYDKAITIAQDAVYLEYYAQKFLSNPLANGLVYADAAFYVAYANAAKGLSALEIAADRIDEDGYELTAEEVSAVLSVFGLTEADKALISGGDGRITIRSVEAYANKVLKNMARAEREALEDRIDDLLDEAEDRIEVFVEAAIADYKPQIDAIIASARAAVNALKAQALTVPAVNTMIEEFEAVAELYNRLIADGELCEDDIEELAEEFARKAKQYKDKLILEIPAEDKAEIDAKREVVRERMTEEKAALDKALKDAEAQAKAYLEGLKNSRKQ